MPIDALLFVKQAQRCDTIVPSPFDAHSLNATPVLSHIARHCSCSFSHEDLLFRATVAVVRAVVAVVLVVDDVVVVAGLPICAHPLRHVAALAPINAKSSVGVQSAQQAPQLLIEAVIPQWVLQYAAV